MKPHDEYKLAIHNITGAVATVAAIQGLDLRDTDDQIQIDNIIGSVVSQYCYALPLVDRHHGGEISRLVHPPKEGVEQ